MPYTTQQARERVRGAKKLDRPGDLAYAIAFAIELYRQQHGDSYQTHGEIRGALATVESEFYERVQKAYESNKMKENGEVFDPWPSPRRGVQ
jgi:hypothetical protein